jgi:RimJ/RimL family protein N-acetyltransferase
MTAAPILYGDRLILRGWRPSDVAEFARLNADPQVMEYFPKCLSRFESDALAEQIRRHFDEHGFGLWAVEVTSDASFIGFVGLATVRFQAQFTPAVEIGWRLARAHWGRGYATEAAKRVLAFAFDVLELPAIVSFTAVNNRRSRAVMQRIGLSHDRGDDFEHPALPSGHPLRRHVLNRLKRKSTDVQEKESAPSDAGNRQL